MARRVNLDAMIPREDFEVKEEETAIDLFKDFPITHLAPDLPYLRAASEARFSARDEPLESRPGRDSYRKLSRQRGYSIPHPVEVTWLHFCLGWRPPAKCSASVDRG